MTLRQAVSTSTSSARGVVFGKLEPSQATILPISARSSWCSVGSLTNADGSLEFNIATASSLVLGHLLGSPFSSKRSCSGLVAALLAGLWWLVFVFEVDVEEEEDPLVSAPGEGR